MNNMILKNNYYCFIAGLPEVFLDDRKLALSVNGFPELARGGSEEGGCEVDGVVFSACR